ncbi:MAG: HAMP domain-containing protein [Verrucomicrobiae bacterium]|nr:HAMP domain-containing protein [Verrucomicrobiae bacterium]
MGILRLSSLRVRLLMVLGLALSPAVLLLGVANWQAWQAYSADAEDAAQQLIEFSAVRHRDAVESARRVLMQMVEGHSNPEGAPHEDSNLQNPFFSNVGVVDRDGAVVLSAAAGESPAKVIGQVWFERAQREYRFFVENRGHDPVTGRAAILCVLPMHHPERGFEGLAFAALNTEMLCNHVSPGLPTNTRIQYYTGDGVLLAENKSGNAPAPSMTVRLEAFLHSRAFAPGEPPFAIFEDEGWLRVIHRIPVPAFEADTFIVISMPRAELAGAAIREMAINWTILGLVLLLAVSLAWEASDRLFVKRAESLVAATEKLARGDLSARTGFVSRRDRDELDELAEKFDFMANRLQKQEQERAILEEQVRLAQKMEAVGLLAGGVAHDFNNLLQVISGSTLLAQGKLPPDSPARKHLDHVRQSSERATKLTRQLLATTRQQALNKEATELNELVVSLLDVIRRTIGEHIAVRFSPEEKAAWASADRGQIEQVLLNLCLNSRDAMRNGGELEIRTRHVRRAATADLREGDYVEITVSDTGHGIPRRGTPAHL